MEELGGRYRTVRRIGSGGMAEVLEAVSVGESGFSRRVAIKRILREHAADESFARMFLDEARIASQLHHASIVAVLDYGMLDGVPFQVLEFVDGLDAAKLQERGSERGLPMPVGVALHVCREVAHALQHAHEATSDDGQPLGVVHRDVNPKNILVSWGGDVKLTDFGIAIARGRAEKTMAGQAKGTLAYMAPEQATAGDVDPRTDLFSLGCVLHALLTGRSPMSGEDRLAALLSGSEVPIDPAIPADISAILRRSLSRSKSHRYRDASAMAEALGAALAARTTKDPRTLVRAWIGELRKDPAASETAAPAEDVQLVFAEKRGTVRVFQTNAGTGAGTSTVIPSTTQHAPIRPARWRVSRILSAVVLVLGALVVTPFVRRDVPAPGELAVHPTPASQAPRTPLTPSTPPPTTAPVVATTVSPRATRAPTPRSTPIGNGVIAIGGEKVHRAEIRVDGVASGYAPKSLELPAGRHVVELFSGDGSRLARRVVDVSSRHTAGSPLRVVIE